MAEEKKILLIEDDREITSIFSEVLRHAGYTVVSAINGLEGRRLIEQQQPELVITDMMMPKMGGFPILEFMQSLDPRPKIIMITANEGSRHQAYAEMLGVDPRDYLRKPIPPEVLLESVERLIGPGDDNGGGSQASKVGAKKSGTQARLRRNPRRRT